MSILISDGIIFMAGSAILNGAVSIMVWLGLAKTILAEIVVFASFFSVIKIGLHTIVVWLGLAVLIFVGIVNVSFLASWICVW